MHVYNWKMCAADSLLCGKIMYKPDLLDVRVVAFSAEYVQ